MSIYGLRMAARTLQYLTRKSAVLQNNLANQTTDGFKTDYAFGAATASAGAPVLQRAINMSQGGMLETGNPLDVALEGPGFFVVQTDQGPRLTRNGAFHLNDDRQLVDAMGRPVLGPDGPIVVNGDSVTISPDGSIAVDGIADVDALRVVTVANPGALSKDGMSLFVPDGPLSEAPPGTAVRQFSLEESNVNAIDGIGDLIEVQRNFAMMTGAMQTMDNVLETVTNNVGRV